MAIPVTTAEAEDAKELATIRQWQQAFYAGYDVRFPNSQSHGSLRVADYFERTPLGCDHFDWVRFVRSDTLTIGPPFPKE